MLQHRLSRNMHITLRNREYVIEKRLPDRTIRIKDVLTDERTAMPEEDLIEALFEKGAELLGHNRNQDALKLRLEKTGVCDIATLKEDDPRKIELQRRISYVEATQAARVGKRTKETLKPIIEKVSSLSLIVSLLQRRLFADGFVSTTRPAEMRELLCLRRRRAETANAGSWVDAPKKVILRIIRRRKSEHPESQS